MAFAAGNQPLFGKGMFTIDPNSTPEQIATKRALMQALMPRFGSAKYVGEGLGQLATGVAMGARGRKLDTIESENRAKADAMFSGVLGGSMSGPMNILGVDPSYGQAPAAPVDPNSPEQIGADTMAALGKDPASLVKQGLVARGMPEHIADGFVMNFKDESGLNPGINEQAPIVPGSRGGFGLAQWTGPRRKALEAYAAAQGKPVSDMNVQLDFLMTELQGSESSAWQQIAASPDAGTAGAAIVNSFLRPAEEHRTRRAAAYTGGNPASNTATPQIPMDQLMGLMQNPWLAPEQRAMLETMMGQRMQAGGPMRQVEVQKARLELDQLQNPPPPAPPEEYTNRIFMAQAAGLQPDTPEFQNYLLTGELPGAAGGDVPASFAAMDLQAKAAGLQPGTPEYQDFMRNGGSSGAPAAFIALDMQAQAAGLAPGSDDYKEFMATRGAGLIAEAKARGEDTATLDSMSSKMAGIEQVVTQLEALADKATYTYIGQGADMIGKQLGFDPSEGAVARSEYIAMVDNQVLPMLRDTFGAAFTVKEGETLRDTLGDPNKSPQEKKVVLRAFIEQKRRDIEALETRTGRTDAGAATAPKAADMSDDDFLKSLGMGN